jgi:hypothetical protein
MEAPRRRYGVNAKLVVIATTTTPRYQFPIRINYYKKSFYTSTNRHDKIIIFSVGQSCNPENRKKVKSSEAWGFKIGQNLCRQNFLTKVIQFYCRNTYN